jgi:hypothetical protein
MPLSLIFEPPILKSSARTNRVKSFILKRMPVLDLLLLLDVSGSVREILPEIANSAADALASLQPGDRAAVMAFRKPRPSRSCSVGLFKAF